MSIETKSRTEQSDKADNKIGGTPPWSEAVFRALADDIIDGVYCINTDGYFVFINRTVIERSGIPPDKFYASHFLDIVHPAYHDLAAQNFQRVMRGEEGIPYELRYERTDGQEIVVEVNSKPLCSDGQVIGLLGISRNITERKLAEERIKASEGQFRTLIESIPIGIVIYKGTKYSYVNPAVEKITGYTGDELYLMDVWEIVHPEFRDKVKEYVHKQQKGDPSPKLYVIKIVKKSGEERWVERGAIPIGLGEKPSVLITQRDITDYKRAEEALREAHRRLDDIIEFLPDATFVIDADSKVVAWNRAIEQMTGVPKTAMIGKGEYEYALPFYGERRPIFIDLTLLPDTEFEKGKYDIAQRSADTIYGETYVPKIYGGKGAYLSGAASRLRDTAGNIIGAIESMRDITERKHAEHELAKYREDLEQLVAERTQELEDKTKALEEVNISLKVLLRHREEDKKELEDRFVMNIKKLIMPFAEKMKRTHLDERQLAYLSIIEKHLNDITSSLTKRIHQFNFTPREIEVASLLNEGKTTKEIATIIGIANSSINTHRNQIRKKLGISKKKVNLRSHLQSFD